MTMRAPVTDLPIVLEDVSFVAGGVTIVDARRYAVTTHERCSIPPRSPTMVGNAVETIVWSSAASSRTRTSAEKITRMRGGCEVTLRPFAGGSAP